MGGRRRRTFVVDLTCSHLGVVSCACVGRHRCPVLVVVAWLGAAAWLYSEGQLAWAIFMGLWGLIMVSGSDNIIRPLLIKRSSAMPLSLIILGVFGGLIAFGFLGLFIGPALLAVAHGLLKAWRSAES